MATEKQVQSLAKKMALLIGKMDLEVEQKEIDRSQETINQAFSKQLAKKNNKKD